MQFSLPRWNITSETGYEPKTTFWQDFWIAVPFGASAVKDTYNRAFKEWQYDEVYITEMALVLNHIGWALYGKPEKEQLCKLFFDLYNKLDEWCREHLNEEQLQYYWNVMDKIKKN
ncbi:MAG: hypothetical protein J6R40_00695 [Clostridia bacterium]|nr:hypothetical protein [Clostridia bacterium]